MYSWVYFIKIMKASSHITYVSFQMMAGFTKPSTLIKRCILLKSWWFSPSLFLYNTSNWMMRRCLKLIYFLCTCYTCWRTLCISEMTARTEKGPFNRRDSEAWEGDNCVPVFFSRELCEQMGNKQCLLCLRTTQSILYMYIHMSCFKRAYCNYHLLAFTVCFASVFIHWMLDCNLDI